MTRTRTICRLSVVALATALLPAAGRADLITSPPGVDVAGNGQSVDPFTNVGDANGNRYQQVFAASFFAGVGPTQSITAVAFRPKQGAFGTFIGSTLTVSDLQIRLSTTPRNADTDFPNGLSNDLATNHGADVQTVFSGPVSLSTTRTLFATGVPTFDFLITFQSAFAYSPAAGNLLLEVIVPAGAVVGSNGRAFPQLDTFTDGFPSRDGTASATDADLTDGLTVGRNSTTGVVTQFTTDAVTPAAVPAPPALVLLAFAALPLAAAARRRRVTAA